MPVPACVHVYVSCVVSVEDGFRVSHPPPFPSPKLTPNQSLKPTRKGFKIQPVHLGGVAEGEGLFMLHTYKDLPSAQQVRRMFGVSGGRVGVFWGEVGGFQVGVERHGIPVDPFD